MKKIYLFICMMMAVGILKSQLIDSVAYTPKFPNPGDTIYFKCYVRYPGSGCPLTTKDSYQGSGYYFYMRAFHCVGQLSALCSDVDKFKIVTQVNYPGVYTFYYMPGFDTTGVCMDPPYQYPYAIQSVSIPVGVVGIAHNQIDNFKVNYFPNPVQNKLFINTEYFNQQNSTINISNIFGQLIQTYNYTSQTIDLDLSGYTSGIYFVTIQNDDKTKTFKIIKQ